MATFGGALSSIKVLIIDQNASLNNVECLMACQLNIFDERMTVDNAIRCKIGMMVWYMITSMLKLINRICF